MSRYGAIFSPRGAKPMALGALVSRQSTMLVLGQLLLVRQASGSFAIGGTAIGAYAVGQGVGAPLWGRQVDRRGPRDIVACLAIVSAVALAALALAASEIRVWPVLLVGLSAAAGFFTPPTIPAMRTMWGRLLSDPTELQLAYALEAGATELAFVTGPMLAAIALAFASPAATVLAGAGFLLAGSLIFATSCDASSASQSAPSVSRDRPTLALPGMARLVSVWVALGGAFAALEVTVVGICQGWGSGASSGLMLSLFAAGTVFGSMACGWLPLPEKSGRRLRSAVLAFTTALAALAVSVDVLQFAVILFLAGVCAGPLATTTSQLLDELIPTGTATEGFAWILTAFMLGSGLGAQLGAVAFGGVGWRLSLVVPVAFAGWAALGAREDSQRHGRGAVQGGRRDGSIETATQRVIAGRPGGSEMGLERPADVHSFQSRRGREPTAASNSMASS